MEDKLAAGTGEAGTGAVADMVAGRAVGEACPGTVEGTKAELAGFPCF